MSSLLSLPPEILSSIFRRLPLVSRARFSCVCTALRSISLSDPTPPLPLQFPFLFSYNLDPHHRLLHFYDHLYGRHDDDDDRSTYSLYDIPTSHTFPNFPFPLSSSSSPHPLTLLSSSASTGLAVLLSAHHRLHLIHLFNPSQQTPVPLPPLPLSLLISKALVSFSRGTLVVTLLLHVPPTTFLAFLLQGRTQWSTLVPTGDHARERRPLYCDVAAFGDYVLTLEESGRVDVWDLVGGPARSRFSMQGWRPREYEVVQRCLVSVRDEGREAVWMVWRWVYQANVRVYRLDFRGRRWIELRSLGDHVLFLSKFSSMAVSVNDITPGPTAAAAAVRREMVYYLDKDVDWACYAYDFVGRTVERVDNVWRDARPPVWVMPNFG